MVPEALGREAGSHARDERHFVPSTAWLRYKMSLKRRPLLRVIFRFVRLPFPKIRAACRRPLNGDGALATTSYFRAVLVGAVPEVVNQKLFPKENIDDCEDDTSVELLIA
jgi:hypothetical protein